MFVKNSENMFHCKSLQRPFKTSTWLGIDICLKKCFHFIFFDKIFEISKHMNMKSLPYSTGHNISKVYGRLIATNCFERCVAIKI